MVRTEGGGFGAVQLDGHDGRRLFRAAEVWPIFITIFAGTGIRSQKLLADYAFQKFWTKLVCASFTSLIQLRSRFLCLCH